MTKKDYHYHTKGKLPLDIRYTRGKLAYQYRQEGWTLQKIGTMFGLTRERVRQILEDFEKERQEILKEK